MGLYDYTLPEDMSFSVPAQQEEEDPLYGLGSPDLFSSLSVPSAPSHDLTLAGSNPESDIGLSVHASDPFQKDAAGAPAFSPSPGAVGVQSPQYSSAITGIDSQIKDLGDKRSKLEKQLTEKENFDPSSAIGQALLALAPALAGYAMGGNAGGAAGAQAGIAGETLFLKNKASDDADQKEQIKQQLQDSRQDIKDLTTQKERYVTADVNAQEHSRQEQQRLEDRKDIQRLAFGNSQQLLTQRQENQPTAKERQRVLSPEEADTYRNAIAETLGVSPEKVTLGEPGEPVTFGLVKDALEVAKVKQNQQKIQTGMNRESRLEGPGAQKGGDAQIGDAAAAQLNKQHGLDPADPMAFKPTDTIRQVGVRQRGDATVNAEKARETLRNVQPVMTMAQQGTLADAIDKTIGDIRGLGDRLSTSGYLATDLLASVPTDDPLYNKAQEAALEALSAVKQIENSSSDEKIKAYMHQFEPHAGESIGNWLDRMQGVSAFVRNMAKNEATAVLESGHTLGNLPDKLQSGFGSSQIAVGTVSKTKSGQTVKWDGHGWAIQ